MRVQFLKVTNRANNIDFLGKGSTGVDWGNLDGVPSPLCGQPFISKKQESELYNNSSKYTGKRLNTLLSDTFGKYNQNIFPEKRAIDQYYSRQPSFGNSNISPDILKKISNIPCPICGSEILTSNKCQNWLTTSSQCSGSNLSRLLHDTFAKQTPDRIESKVASNCYEIVTEPQGTLNLEAALRILKNKAKIDGEQAFYEIIYKNSEVLENSNWPDNIKQKLLSYYDQALSGIEAGKPLPQVYRSWKTSLMKHKKESERHFYQETFTNVMKQLDPIAAACIFIKNRETVSQTAKRLIQPYLPTFDHIIPKSKGGENSIYNYVPMHKGCNEERDTLSWKQLTTLGATTIEKIQNFVDTMLQSIRNGNANGLEKDYIEGIVDRLNYQLGGDYISYKI